MKPEEKDSGSDSLNSLVVPKGLWDRMCAIVINVKNSPVRHAGTSCYDSGLFDKRTIDGLCEEVKRHNRCINGK